MEKKEVLVMTWPTTETVGWYTNQLKAFQGWTVLGAEDDDEGYYCLVLENPETKELGLIWFYSDDEGNSPGSFEITRRAKDTWRR